MFSRLIGHIRNYWNWMQQKVQYRQLMMQPNSYQTHILINVMILILQQMDCLNQAIGKLMIFGLQIWEPVSDVDLGLEIIYIDDVIQDINNIWYWYIMFSGLVVSDIGNLIIAAM